MRAAVSQIEGPLGASIMCLPSKTYRFVYSNRCNMCSSGMEHQVFIGRRLDQRQGLWPRSKPGITTSIFRCKHCNLIYSNPTPIPETIEQHYDVAPEDYWPEAEALPEFPACNISTFELLC